MQQGYVGFSSDGLPLHYLANDPHRNEKIPAQHATLNEISALAEVVRVFKLAGDGQLHAQRPAVGLQKLRRFSGAQRALRRHGADKTAVLPCAGKYGVQRLFQPGNAAALKYEATTSGFG